MERAPSEAFEATYDSGTTGLVGTVEVAIQDNEGNVVFGPTAAGITELEVGGTPTAVYAAELSAPSDEGDFSILWSDDGSFDPNTGAVEDLTVTLSAALSLPSLGPGIEDSILCSAWTTSELVLDCCPNDNLGSDTTRLDQAIVAASELLYLAEGKQHVGVCTTTARPCVTDFCRCGYQVLSRGHLVGWDGNCWGGYACGCRADSVVKLAGYVREITQVLIDGEVVDPDTYFVYNHEDLTRKDGARWPSCQSTDVDDDAEGAFAVTYTYGKAPPQSGRLAAARLACEIVKSCREDETCAIPNGVIRQTRQGITIERAFLLRDESGRWRTGMGEVDYYLNTVNPNGLSRSATFWSPSRSARFARTSPT